MMTEFSFPQLIVVPLSCHEVDGVRKEKERLTAAQRGNDQKRAVKIRNDHKNPRYFPWNSSSNWWKGSSDRFIVWFLTASSSLLSYANPIVIWLFYGKFFTLALNSLPCISSNKAPEQ